MPAQSMTLVLREKIVVWQTQRTHLKHYSTKKIHMHTDIKVSL